MLGHVCSRNSEIECDKRASQQKYVHCSMPPCPEGSPADVTWLGCLHLKAVNGTDFFGGLSGSFMHGNRLLMVSDTNRKKGSGRFFAGDLVMKAADPANGLGDQKVVPIDLKNLTVQPLRDEHGDFLTDDRAAGDSESLGVRWPPANQPTKPAVILVGLEREHKVRIYNVMSTDGHPSSNI